MPNMHVSVFIQPAERITASSLVLSETNSFTISVRLHPGNGHPAGEVSLFADSIKQMADFGRAIVEQCEILAAGPASAPVDPFLPSYAINDAVQHDEAMAEQEAERYTCAEDIF